MSQKMIFAVLDAAAGTFANPWFVPHLGVAVRAFTDEVNRIDDSNNLNKHPQDFALYKIGTYDDVSGVIEPLSKPELVAQAASVKNAG